MATDLGLHSLSLRINETLAVKGLIITRKPIYQITINYAFSVIAKCRNRLDSNNVVNK